MMKFSVIIPAHNEEKYIEGCLKSIISAKTKTDNEVEIIVCVNRCTDRTEDIARKYGSIIIKDENKNLSKIRNNGVSRSSGNVIVTIDSDSRMSENTFLEIEKHLDTNKYIGGGTKVKLERWSLGIVMSMLVILFVVLRQNLFVRSGGLFWCYRIDYDAIGGFNEDLVTVEDLDFAKRLKIYGRSKDKLYGTLKNSYILTSCRKFDQYGDWYFFFHPIIAARLYSNRSKDLANKFYYDAKR